MVDTYATTNNLLVLAGSNYCDGESFRGLSVAGKTVEPTFRFLNNMQRVRASWFNCHVSLKYTQKYIDFIDFLFVD